MGLFVISLQRLQLLDRGRDFLGRCAACLQSKDGVLLLSNGLSFIVDGFSLVGEGVHGVRRAS